MSKSVNKVFDSTFHLIEFLHLLHISCQLLFV